MPNTSLRFTAFVSLISMHAFAQAAEAADAKVPEAAQTAPAPATSATPAGCYPGKQNGEDVLFCPRVVESAPVMQTESAGATEWYGWQTLLADGAALSLVVGGASLQSNKTAQTGGGLLAVGGALTYVLGGPIIHVVNERALTGLASLGLRVGVPVGGTLLGAIGGSAVCRDSSGNWICALVGGVIGFSVGILGAVIVDASVLARKPVAPAKEQQSVRWIPDLSLSPTGGSAGVRGTF
jgi:hypothetical protein